MTWRGTGEPVAGWWVEVNVVEGMSYGAALATARDLGGVVAETRRGLIRRVGYAPARSSNAHADLPAVAGKVRRVVGNSGDVP